MSDPATFDVPHAHKFFSAECFNRTWDLIDKSPRTPEEDEQMRSLCHASLWHWTQRVDCTAQNLSIAYWQLARVYALLGLGADATRYGQFSLVQSKDEPAFYLGYAHEALARAAMVCGDGPRLTHHLSEARRLAAQVTDPADRATLAKDLDSIR